MYRSEIEIGTVVRRVLRPQNSSIRSYGTFARAAVKTVAIVARVVARGGQRQAKGGIENLRRADRGLLIPTTQPTPAAATRPDWPPSDAASLLARSEFFQEAGCAFAMTTPDLHYSIHYQTTRKRRRRQTTGDGGNALGTGSSSRRKY